MSRKATKDGSSDMRRDIWLFTAGTILVAVIGILLLRGNGTPSYPDFADSRGATEPLDTTPPRAPAGTTPHSGSADQGPPPSLIDLDSLPLDHRFEVVDIRDRPQALVAAGLVATGRGAMSVGMSRSVEWVSARLGLLRAIDSPIRVSMAAGEGSCIIEDNRVRATSPGRCGVRVETEDGAGVIEMTILPAPTRSEIDRPGPNLLDLKPVYIRFSDSPDMQRDTNGQIATFVHDIADFYATQHPGHTLRVDHFDGVPDVQHIELPLTTQQFTDQWTDNLGPLADLLREHGIGEDWEQFYSWARGNTRPGGIEQIRRIYVGIVEAPRGAYRSPNNNIEGGCGSSSGNAFIVYFVRELDGSDCFPDQRMAEYGGAQDDGWRGFDALRLAMATLNGNRGCDAAIFSQWEVPLEERPGSIGPLTDIIAYGYRGSQTPKQFDPEGKYYFRINQGPWVGDPCRDVIYSPFVTDIRHDTRPFDDRPGRSLVDRPDDLDGPQVRVLYVLPADSPDDGWDVDGTLDREVKAANEWLFTQGDRRVKFDTSNGDLDVTFVRLPYAEAELWVTPFRTGRKCGPEELCPHPRDLMPVLKDMGVLSPDKIHILVYGGGFNPAVRSHGLGCAGAIEVGAMMKPGVRDLMEGFRRCQPWIPATTPDSENAFGLVILHEIFHALGAVSRGAPDADDGYHIGNDPSDLMGGSQGTVKLDPLRRNYWDHGRRDLADITRSALLVPSDPNAVLPPDWNRWLK